jgi:hypothetical protein
MEEYKKYIDLETKLIQKYIEETKSSISLISPNTIGKIADNNNKIDILLRDVDIKKSKNDIKNIIDIIKSLYEIKNIIIDNINETKSEEILKNVLAGRSFTFVADIKKLREKIDSVDILMQLYDEVVDEFIKKMQLFDDKNNKNLIDFVSYIENDNHIAGIDILLKNIDDFYNSDIDIINRIDKIIDKLTKKLMKFDFEPTPNAELLMRTYEKDLKDFEKIFQQNDTEKIFQREILKKSPSKIEENDKQDDESEISPSEIICIDTGETIIYNLQGLVDANWIAKNKLADSPGAGLSNNAVKRLNTISKDENKIDKSRKFTFNRDAKYITFGGDIYELKNFPELNVEQITYGRILAENAAENIVLVPPEVEYRNKKTDESIKEGILLRIKSNVSADLRKVDFKSFKDLKNINDLLKKVTRICAGAIKNSLYTAENNTDALLNNMSALTDAYKRVDIGLITQLNERFGQISLEELMAKNDLNEIIQSLASKAINEIDRQPSIL